LSTGKIISHQFNYILNHIGIWWNEYGGTSMVERVWWNEVLLVSIFVGAFFFGVINVPVYEAPKELTIILLTLPVLMI
jgi:hypothetical protein